MYTDNPIRDAEVYYMQRDKHQEEQAEAFCQRVTDSMHDLETFQMFLHDIDPDAPEVQAFHGCLDGDEQDKLFAYDQFMNLYEEYVASITEL